MPKLTIHIDESTRRRIERAAKRERLSPSRWVRVKLTKVLDNAWPEGYFDLFGSLAGEKLTKIEEGKRDDGSR